MRKTVCVFLMCLVTLCAFEAAAQDDIAISKNRIVSLQYTLFIDGNKVIETTMGKGSMTYVHGKGQLLEALEDELEGMRKGQEKNIVINPKDAYGEINKEFIIKMPLEKLPGGAGVEGEVLSISGEDTTPVKCTVTKIDSKNATLDFNHPLAGKILRYKVKIIDVKDIRQLG